MAGPNSPRNNARAERLDRLAGSRAAQDDSAQAVTRGALADMMAEDISGVAGRIITAKSAALSGDVALSTSGTWYDGPSVGLTPGTYLITAQALHRNDAAAAASVVQVRIHDGTSALAALQASVDAASGLCAPFALVTPVKITRAKAITLQMRASAGHANSKMKSTAPDAGTETVATRILALRIGE